MHRSNRLAPDISYRGVRTEDGCKVWRVKEDATSTPLDPRFDLRNHSPAGFNWGFCGSGPAQLALAILADATGSAFAEVFYQLFKMDVISRFKGDDFDLTLTEVVRWCSMQRVTNVFKVVDPEEGEGS